MTEELAATYPKHIETLCQRHEAALEASKLQRVVIHSGAARRLFMDDNTSPFRANPPFKAWVPLVEHPDCCVVFEPGRRPVLVYYQPTDYWHSVPQAPAGYWPAHFELKVVKSHAEMVAALPAAGACTGWLGEPDHCPNPDYTVNPPRLVSELDFARACKTEYELNCMRGASARGARAHTAAHEAFMNGGSEFDIHLQYCAAAAQGDNDLPYSNIIALNENGATLHYTALNRAAPAQRHSLLIDAGASFCGYASDITRSYAYESEAFAALIDEVDRLQQTLCGRVTAGRSYIDIHLEAHALVAAALVSQRFVNCTPDAAVQQGITSIFFPHGIGHFIGLQVHDVGGHQKNPQGESAPPPPAHPFLRLTRTLQPGHVVTIEPGIYMIDQLLDEARKAPFAADINWNTVESLHRFGGVRIEDDVVCTDDAPENLTRDAFAAQA